MLTRAVLVWCVLLLLAIVNGAVREGILTPRLGPAVGHALSTVTLCLAILLLAWITIAWIGPRSFREAWTAGGVWLVLTLAFEFLAGHYLFGQPWSRLLDDYDILHGRIWVIVLVTTMLAPIVTAHLRRLLR